MYIAIPTYNRSDVLEQKTLTTLIDGGVDPKQIYIFVANQTEKNKYENAIPKEKYHSIVIGKLGITPQRVFIKNYFEEGSEVVSVDDDIEGIFKLHGDKLKQIRTLPFFMDAFKRLHKEKKYMWGIYPVRNPFFMHKTVCKGLCFVIGALYGFIVRHDKELEPKAPVKQDYEQSILYYLKDGGVIRFNDITIKTKFLAKGGIGPDRYDKNEKAVAYLKKKYPTLFSVFYRKGMAEIRFTRKLSTKV